MFHGAEVFWGGLDSFFQGYQVVSGIPVGHFNEVADFSQLINIFP
jgi:hypothetical protein